MNDLTSAKWTPSTSQKIKPEKKGGGPDQRMKTDEKHGGLEQKIKPENKENDVNDDNDGTGEFEFEYWTSSGQLKLHCDGDCDGRLESGV